MPSSILALSPLVLILGVMISLISVWQAFATGKTPRERLFTIITAVLAIALLIVQAAKNKRADSDAQLRMQAALDAQRIRLTIELTGAFKAGTDQLMKAAGLEADETRKATDDATLGSNKCPQIGADTMSNQRPFALSVFNTDKSSNIYDLTVYVQEGEHAPPDGKGFHTLQEKTLRFPVVPAGAGSSLPFTFLSQRNTSYLQFSLSTRRKICSGQIVLHGDGNGAWRTETLPIHAGPLASHPTEVPPQDHP